MRAEDERLPLVERILNSLAEEILTATTPHHRDQLIADIAYYNHYRRSIIEDINGRQYQQAI